MAERQSGRPIWGLVAILGLAVALAAVWVWPSSRDGAADAEPAQVDTSGPVGRIGQTTAGSNTAAVDPIETSGARGYAGSAGTGSISGPIGGLEVVRGTGGATVVPPGVATGSRGGSGR